MPITQTLHVISFPRTRAPAVYDDRATSSHQPTSQTWPPTSPSHPTTALWLVTASCPRAAQSASPLSAWGRCSWARLGTRRSTPG